MGILPQKGIISVGSDADIAIVDLNKKQVPSTDPKEIYSAAGSNVYGFLGWELKGWPVLTMVRGNIVMEDGKVIGKEGTGKYIKRKLFHFANVIRYNSNIDKHIERLW